MMIHTSFNGVVSTFTFQAAVLLLWKRRFDTA